VKPRKGGPGNSNPRIFLRVSTTSLARLPGPRAFVVSRLDARRIQRHRSARDRRIHVRTAESKTPPLVEIPQAHHHLILDQPLAFIAALRALPVRLGATRCRAPDAVTQNPRKLLDCCPSHSRPLESIQSDSSGREGMVMSSPCSRLPQGPRTAAPSPQTFRRTFPPSRLMGDCGADFLKPICRRPVELRFRPEATLFAACMMALGICPAKSGLPSEKPTNGQVIEDDLERG